MRLLNVSGSTDLRPPTKKKKLFLIIFSKLTLKALNTFIMIFKSSQIYLHISAKIHTYTLQPQSFLYFINIWIWTISL